MFALVLRREEMGLILSRRSAGIWDRVESVESFKFAPLEIGQHLALWSFDPREQPDVPEVLVVQTGREVEFLAWINTFAPGLRPFTALCRVVSEHDFSERMRSWQRPSLRGLELAGVGLVLGEVLSSEQGLEYVRSDSPSVAACSSVLSFPLVRELALNGMVRAEPSLSDRWVSARRVTQQKERNLTASDVVLAMEVLRAVCYPGYRLSSDAPVRGFAQACADIIRHGGTTLDVWGSVFPVLSRVVSQMQGPRENRVRAFEEFVGSLQPSHVEKFPNESSFVIGVLASLIGPGSLVHAPLVVPVLTKFRTAMLWYGLCAGIHEGSSVLDEFRGIGRRILRELLKDESLVGRPRCDISVVELDVLLGGEKPLTEFATMSPSQLYVDLDPGVWIAINWPAKEKAKPVSGQQTQPGQNLDRERVAAEFYAAIGRLDQLVEQATGVRRQGEQFELEFKHPKRGRRR